MYSAVAVRDISDESLAASTSALSISSTSTSDDVTSQCQADALGCCCSTTAVNISHKQTKLDTDADQTAKKTSVMAASENSAVDDVTSCSRTDVNPSKSSSLASTGDGSNKDSAAVSSVLCLLHGLSHSSYHEPSLLVLAEHATYDAAADLFVSLWHRLQTTHQHEDKIQA